MTQYLQLINQIRQLVSLYMQNALNPAPNYSQQKILSTENSRNSTFTNLVQQKEKASEQDSNLRLFTFMNIRNEELKQDGRISNNNRKKSSKKIGNKLLKRDQSGLISMIQESRKKRENFYKLILDSQSLVSIDNDRKCKTPTNLRHSSNNVSVKCFNSKKFITPKASTNKQCSFFQKEQKPRKKTLQPKNSNSQIRLSIKKQETKHIGGKIEKIVPKLDKVEKMDKQEQAALFKKKKDLQKQLLEINQTILLGHHKKRNKAPKTRR